MKTAIPLLAAFAALIACRLVASPPFSNSPSSLGLRNLDRYVRITDRPFEMHDVTVVACRAPEDVARNPHKPVNPKTAFCNVYVNAVAKDPMVSGKGIYPEGSIVIKSKLATIDSREPELFTVMQKMAKGYDENHGDWRYSVVDGTSYRQLASGRIDSCIECHEQHKETDYITREYIAGGQRRP